MQDLSGQPFSLLALILAILGLLFSGFLFWQLRKLEGLKKTFFAGKTGLDLEMVLMELAHELQRTKDQQQVLEESLHTLHHNFNFAVQKVGLVRFNPFNDGGGNFSFALALLDAHDSGAVLTSMHGREQNRIYAKRILNGKSELQLTEEEVKAVQMANDQFQISNVKQSNKSMRY